jgi:DnaJ-class molecular chaperone
MTNERMKELVGSGEPTTIAEAHEAVQASIHRTWRLQEIRGRLVEKGKRCSVCRGEGGFGREQNETTCDACHGLGAID